MPSFASVVDELAHSPITSTVTSGWNWSPRCGPRRNAEGPAAVLPQLDGAERHRELLVVPVKPRPAREHAVAALDLEPADLRRLCARDSASEGDRQRLAAEAQPEHRDRGRNRGPQQRQLRADPLERRIGGRLLRAERDDERRVASSGIGPPVTSCTS